MSTNVEVTVSPMVQAHIRVLDQRLDFFVTLDQARRLRDELYEAFSVLDQHIIEVDMRAGA